MINKKENQKKTLRRFSLITNKKNIYGFLSFFILVNLCSACKDYLIKEPTFIVKENYYNNASDANAALSAIYDILGREQTFTGEVLTTLTISDEGFYARSGQVAGVQVYNFDATNPQVTAFWQQMYVGIERANVFLANIDKANMPEEEKAAVKGEAKFLRAFYYFSLVSYFGDVPLKTTPTPSVNNVDIARTPQREVYNFITREMEEAEGMVKTSTQIGFGGRVSKSAVRGILAKVYLKMAGAPLNDVSKYAEALKWAKKIVYPETGPVEHSLNPDYKQIFINLAADKYDIKESIWEAEAYGSNFGDFEGGRVGNTIGLANNDEAIGYCYGFVNATAKLYNSYEANDVRRDWNIAPYRYNYITVDGFQRVRDSTFWTTAQIYDRNCGKYRRSYEVVKPKNKNYTPINAPLLRYADVLLMLAEAENEVNGPTSVAISALKQVRDRARASDVSALATSKEELRRLIQNERFLELAFEGNRKFDLIRWDIFTSTMNQIGSSIQTTAPSNFRYASLAGRSITVRDNLFPIPIRETSLNKLITQNPGW
jgi:hypothetical protein